MEGHLIYTINGIERKMFFGNYALEKVLKHFKISISKIGEIPPGDEMEFIRVWMYHAACYSILKDGGVPDFTEFDTYEWVDSSKSDILIRVNAAIQDSLGMIDSSDKPEKKKTNGKAKLA